MARIDADYHCSGIRVHSRDPRWFGERPKILADVREFAGQQGKTLGADADVRAPIGAREILDEAPDFLRFLAANWIGPVPGLISEVILGVFPACAGKRHDGDGFFAEFSDAAVKKSDDGHVRHR